ncbi:MAG TPA: ATP-binding protein [Bacteroidales bacterium]|nr:ATP-binding protein [Bacteroidales bacterium]
MVLRSTYLKIIYWVTLIVVASLALSWLIVNHYTIDLILITASGLIGIAYLFTKFITKINRRLTFFFHSLNNEDTSFRILGEPRDMFEKELFESLNQISKKIESIRIRVQEQELQFQAVVEQSNSGLLAFDEQGFIHITNSAAHQLLQCEILTHLKQLKRVNETLYSIILNIKQNETKTVSILENKNQRVLSIKAAGIKLMNNSLTLLSITDIKPELDARETDSWVKLTRVLTHEIMNGIAPVTSITKTVTSYFEKDGSIVNPDCVNEQLIQKTIKGLNIVHQQSIGLMNFVEHFRKFSKMPQPVLKEFLICDLIERIKFTSQDLIQKANATLKVDCTNDKMALMADENLLAQVMTILVSNAADAVSEKPNGTILIKTHTTYTGRVNIEIEDNGIGIPFEILDDIFTPFFSTKPNGTGIGLSIARQIIHLHGGRLEVNSTPNKGSAFRIII